MADDARSTEKIMRRVQALMDRASHPNTPPAEAELCRERVERLMLRHAIDEAVLADRNKSRDEPKHERVPFWGSYVLDRIRLLHQIAGVFQCQVVRYQEYRPGARRASTSSTASLFGFQKDIDMVLTLFDSLNDQMNAAVAAAPRSDVSYRKAFMARFIVTVAARLKRLYTEEVAEAGGASTEIVLRDRRSEVEEFMTQTIGKTTKQSRNRRIDWSGARDGEAAGNRADIFLPGDRFDSSEARASIGA